jgi:polysaccharide biosynthesis/export protein
VNNLRKSLFLALSLGMTGCAVTSGLQTYDLPEQGLYTTDAGTQVNVIKLTQENLYAVQPAKYHPQDLAYLFQQKHQNYNLSAGDILSIYLWAYPEITPPVANLNSEDSFRANGYQIDQDGYIEFPMIGRYKAAGKSIAQVNRELRVQLARFLKTPDVIARVLTYQGQRYSVQGNVMKGGQFYLNDRPTSVYTALGLAGGVNTQFGDNSAITLVRQGKTFDLNSINLESAGYSLHNARENQKIYVMGEAGKNQALPLRDQGMSLSDALGESLGLDPLSASRSKVYVVRNSPTQAFTEIYHLDLTSIGDFGLANQFKMQRNDIVYIDASGLARWQRVFNQVIPFSNMIYSIDRLGQN